MKISRIDKTIIKILVKDTRDSILSTARKAGISVAAIS
jgi:DNA-binding Lrp family transcriptional regulator